MRFTLKTLFTILFFFFACSLLDLGLLPEEAAARARAGGRSFSKSRSISPPPVRAPASANYSLRSNSGGFMAGLAGGLVGGALGGMLFGSLANAGTGAGLGGSSIGLLQLLILGGLGYFVYARFFKKRSLCPLTSRRPARPTEQHPPRSTSK